nr:immunoglobulin light chain junction region [Macaca mulatta]MOV67439.1 immunoglobulin light chain junction region [Macaca mulatta]MOV70893.1 immunoglobulin light chain junction region [Macaca mulatta]
DYHCLAWDTSLNWIF